MNDFTLPERIAFVDPDSDTGATPPAAVELPAAPVSQQSDQPPVQAMPPRPIGNGRVALAPQALRNLRHGRMLSQQDLADECERRRIRVSIATIKRAETGHAVRFRIVRELARCFEVPVTDLLPG